MAARVLAPDDPRHGTITGYYNYRCRCEPCRQASREYVRERGIIARQREWRHRTGRCTPRADYLAEIKPDHGTESRYSSGCRCDLCRRAAAEARKRRRHANPEAARAYDRKRRSVA